MVNFLDCVTLLSHGIYLQIPVRITLLDETIIRSNEPEEVLSFNYKSIGNRFIIPFRKIKGKLRRLVLEKQRGLGIEVNCALKDDLCMQCPSCFLFGGTGETSSVKTSYNILSRIYGETFISETETITVMPYTANAINEKDLKTGQALMSIVTVPKETTFLGVITLKDPTIEMATIIIDNLNRLTRIGARNNEWGRVKTEILGYYLGDREELSAYLHIAKEQDIYGYIKNKIFDILPDVDVSYNKLYEQVKNVLQDLSKDSDKNNKKKDNNKKTETADNNLLF